MSEQHVTPQWVRRVLPGGEEPEWLSGLIRDGKVTRESKGRAATIRYKVVCTRCNTGWMSRLEVESQSLLTPLMLGAASPPLDGDRQRLLARWAYQSAVVMDRQPGPSDAPHFPADSALLFGRSEGNILPPRVQVFLARSEYAEEVRPGRPRIGDGYVNHADLLTSRGEQGLVSRAVIREGALVLAVLDHTLEGVDYRPLELSGSRLVRPLLRQIWPPRWASVAFDTLPTLAWVGGISAIVGDNFMVRS